MTTGQCFNWYIPKPQETNMEDLKIDDIKLKWYLTDSEYNERLFLGGTVVGGYFLAKVLKAIYSINKTIETNPEE